KGEPEMETPRSALFFKQTRQVVLLVRRKESPMRKELPHPSVLLIASLLFLAGGAAQATISHTWVSSTGNDANACTRSAPCATFAGALTKTSAGGEIDVADANDYGPVTINKAVSIEAVGVLATIQVTSGNAITVSAGANDTVVLRGLTLDGQG